MQNHAYRIPRVIQYLRAITALDRMFAIGVGRDPRDLVRQQRPLEVIREVEIEILAIPETKADLKRFITESLARREIVTTANFGFAEAGPTSGTLGHGTLQAPHDREWYAREENRRHILNKAVRPTGPGKNQTDASLAVRASYSVILTNDAKTGPLADAARRGGKILSLSAFDRTRFSLKDYISRS